MTGAHERTQALRREAEHCRALASEAWNPKVRQELVAMAARFDELANSTVLHDFGAIMQTVADDIVGHQPVVQQQQQIQPTPQPKKEE
jgi:hypothetical protein